MSVCHGGQRPVAARRAKLGDRCPCRCRWRSLFSWFINIVDFVHLLNAATAPPHAIGTPFQCSN